MAKSRRDLEREVEDLRARIAVLEARATEASPFGAPVTMGKSGVILGTVADQILAALREIARNTRQHDWRDIAAAFKTKDESLHGPYTPESLAPYFPRAAKYGERLRDETLNRKPKLRQLREALLAEEGVERAKGGKQGLMVRGWIVTHQGIPPCPAENVSRSEKG